MHLYTPKACLAHSCSRGYTWAHVEVVWSIWVRVRTLAGSTGSFLFSFGAPTGLLPRVFTERALVNSSTPWRCRVLLVSRRGNQDHLVSRRITGERRGVVGFIGFHGGHFCAPRCRRVHWG